MKVLGMFPQNEVVAGQAQRQKAWSLALSQNNRFVNKPDLLWCGVWLAGHF